MKRAIAYAGHVVGRVIAPLDLPLLAGLLMIMCIGLVVLSSAAADSPILVRNQAIRFAIGLGALLVLAHITPARMRLWTPYIFALTLVLLLLVPLMGTGRSGGRWLYLGFFYLQPSELMKISVPMMVAWLLHRAPLPPGWTGLGASLVVIGIPAGLTAMQPDLGTALLITSSGVFAIFLAGLAWWRIGLLGLAGLSGLPVLWFSLREYQRNRLLTFMDPDADPLGTGWNIAQSKIALGSGGLTGKGWGQGSQSHLDFLPEHTTDFIFAVLGEEFGFVGVGVTLLLYLLVMGRALWLASEARDSYARLLAGALALGFFVYIFVNGGMISGLLPVVGAPMPLLSYGGTSAVSLLAGFGVIMSAHAHRRFLR
ncbi:rod shape-determining protein RodA [Alkalisalibacterium limincola]|uniref:Peptidoglycan glycosyltransferase MrdB n=1 Tax=Alkalisalibacterium limincola TaxID=2699169 RepID=A0A5C8KJY6_9GAMM|nr:rod shape-determining protein RodA [Alkalisalibacterium limincola]TXK59783.1 rod shape-determining protein RodA [Alkalisalibacterium limincola]